jgi:hypothetical protein
MMHDDHWKETWENAHVRLNKLFADSRIRHSVSDVIGDEHGIDSYHDAKKVLTYVLEHNATGEEKACAILSLMEALMAWHELSEHKDSSVPARAGVLVK